tara:strand:- start:5608 stop:6183 length:576 start_codon:yes stop_codon:yes gene_type:complete
MLFTFFLIASSFVNCFIKTPGILVHNVKPRTTIFLDENSTLSHALVPPSGGELKLLTHLSVENWAHNWLMYIANSGVEYDDHYYMDYLNMKGMANMYTSTEYFYLGFYPDNIITNQGPKYIALLDLQHKKRIFNTKCLIENPYYMDGNSELSYFKELLINLTESAYVFFKFTDLNRPGQVRYYLEWKHNNF